MRSASLCLCGLLVTGLVTVGCGGREAGNSQQCGDGVPEAPEECDDGNTVGGDGCSADCLPEHGYVCWETPSICRTSCGDGLVAAEEECDDGNLQQMDGCSANCIVDFGYTCEGEPSGCAAICGDGQILGGETCDDGNTSAGDGCDAGCEVEPGYECEGTPSECFGECGNGGTTPDEGCDDGNLADGDGCDASCEVEVGYQCSGMPSECVPVCGDGLVVGNEPCDDGGESATCDGDCTATSCGDSTINTTAGEACDDGGESANCNGDCSLAQCGDGIVNVTAGETCDDGNSQDDDGCSGLCQPEVGFTCLGEPSQCSTDCGDGSVAGNEECDDGGESVNCDANCTWASCGDGDVNATAGETCDDGDVTDGDGCDSSCDEEYGYACTGAPSVCVVDCGDSVVFGGEECDDGGESVTCDANCTWASCGDGDLNATAGESCDDGNNVSWDGCSATCQAESLLLQPGPTDGKDASVYDLAPTTNYGDVPYAYVMAWTWSGVPGLRRAFFEFEFPTSAAGCTVLSATLSLYHYPAELHEGLSGNTLETEIARVTQAWDEHTITWSNQPPVDAASMITVPPPPSSTADIQVDITALVAYWLANPSDNFGLRLKLQTEVHYRKVSWTSSDYTDDPARRPSLQVILSGCP